MIAQGGAFPDDTKKEAADLIKLALLLGREYVDVETALSPHFIKDIVHLKGASQIMRHCQAHLQSDLTRE